MRYLCPKCKSEKLSFYTMVRCIECQDCGWTGQSLRDCIKDDIIMNAYLVYNDDYSEVVFAETRGKAKSYFVSLVDCEWTDPCHIRLLSKFVNRKPGYAADFDYWWDLSHWPFEAEEDEETGRIYIYG